MKPAELAESLHSVLMELIQHWRSGFPAHNQALSIDEEILCDSWLRHFFVQMPEIPPLEPALRPWILARLATAIGALKQLSTDGSTIPEVAPAALAEYFLISAWHRDLKFRWRGLADDSRIWQN